MRKITVVYHSYRGVSDKLASALVQGISDGGAEAICKQAADASIADLLESDLFVLAAGQPFGTLAGPLKTFIEKCWQAPEREQLQGKLFTYILNGSREPKDSAAYLEKLAGYFKWMPAAHGIAITAGEADKAVDRAHQLGVELANYGR